MKIIPGYTYHISGSYFEKVNDPKLMQNKENGGYRPTYFCIKDDATGLLWMVPLSTKVDKYKEIMQKQIDRHGECLTIVIGNFNSKPNAFLLQNMFPVTEKYITHVHTKNNIPIPVAKHLRQQILTNMRKIKLLLQKKNINLVLSDITKLEQIMIAEQNCENTKDKTESLV